MAASAAEVTSETAETAAAAALVAVETAAAAELAAALDPELEPEDPEPPVSQSKRALFPKTSAGFPSTAFFLILALSSSFCTWA